MEFQNSIYCPDRFEWHNWLTENYKTTDEVWLIYYKKHTKLPTVTYEEAVEEAICFGWIDSLVKTIDEDRYMQKYTPRKPKSVWSLINKKRAEKLIKESRMTEAGLQTIKEAKKSGAWQKAYSTRKDIKMPKDLEKGLKDGNLAWGNFQLFTPSQRRNYIGWVLAAKRNETRKKRIVEVVKRSEKGLKPGLM
ncbi:MAG: YdeI/OmpD-associated family protein [Bacteroidales bacterium]|nr:YdeI/OmpD-associated family protein [Bacteroidales bacterium]